MALYQGCVDFLQVVWRKFEMLRAFCLEYNRVLPYASAEATIRWDSNNSPYLHMVSNEYCSAPWLSKSISDTCDSLGMTKEETEFMLDSMDY